MSSHGELNQRARRPSTPGANTQILFNNNGVDGANSNLTFDKANTILAVGGPANTTPFILNQGRGTISIQGNATQNDALLMFQNSTGFVGGYVYCSNTELRVDSQPGANVTIYGGGVLTVNVGANQMNIAGSLNVTANIANTGNLLVTQNTFTGNLSVTTLANIATANIVTDNVGTSNITGTIAASGSPLTNTVTRAMTGLSINLTANLACNGNSAQTNTLSVTFNETGMYQIEGMLLFGSNNAANVANGGCNIAFGNTGTAVISTIQYAVQGKANGVTILSNLIRTTAQTAVLTSVQTFSGSISANDYLVVTGYMKIGTTGTVNLAFASANSANLSFNVMPNTYIVYTKIG